MTPLLYMLMGLIAGRLVLRRERRRHKSELAARDTTINRQGGEILSTAVKLAAADRRTAEVEARVSRVLANVQADQVVTAVENQQGTWLRGVCGEELNYG